jgi:hypothetical protein
MPDVARLNETILDMHVPNATRNLGAIKADLEPSDWYYVLACGREHAFQALLN